MPGTLCSGTGQYDHCIRLSYGYPWNDRMEKGMETLGGLVYSLLAEERPARHQLEDEEVVIGLNTDPDFLKLKGIVSRFSQRDEDLVLRFHQSLSGNILKLIASGELHGGFIFGECEDDKFFVQPLATHYLRIVGPTQMAEQIVDGEYQDLAELPWIGNPVECPYCRVMEEIFHARGFQPRSVITANEESAILSMIKAGVGLNFMLEAPARELAEEGSLVVWEKERFVLPLSFVTLKSAQEERRVQVAKEVIAKLF